MRLATDDIKFSVNPQYYESFQPHLRPYINNGMARSLQVFILILVFQTSINTHIKYVDIFSFVQKTNFAPLFIYNPPSNIRLLD